MQRDARGSSRDIERHAGDGIMGKRSFGKIQQMRSGRFQASYVDHDGVRRTAPDTFAKRSEADEWLASVRSQLNSNERIDQEAALTTFAKYATDWLADRITGVRTPQIRPKTAQLYGGIIDKHLAPFFGHRALKNITAATVVEWRRWMLGRFRARVAAGDIPRSDATGETRTAQAYRLLHAIMAAAVRDGAIAVNPCNIRGASADHAKERKPATMTEIRTIAENMPERYRALVYVAAWSGLRFSELAGLTRGDVVEIPNPDGGPNGFMLIVNKQTYRIGAKLYEGEPTKTEAGRRNAPMFQPEAVNALRAHLRDYTGHGIDAPVFTARTGSPIASNVVGKMFRRARHAAGRDDLRFHDLRHTCATMLAENGATTKQLMSFMGHHTSKAALIYQHATTGKLTALAAKVAHEATIAENEGLPHGLRVMDGGLSDTRRRGAERLAA